MRVAHKQFLLKKDDISTLLKGLPGKTDRLVSVLVRLSRISILLHHRNS